MQTKRQKRINAVKLYEQSIREHEARLAIVSPPLSANSIAVIKTAIANLKKHIVNTQAAIQTGRLV
jgi:hypothetical protein